MIVNPQHARILVEGASSDAKTLVETVWKRLFEPKALFEVSTSGSTGAPKKLRFEQAQILKSAWESGQTFHYRQGWRVLVVLPINKVSGLMQLARCVVYGMEAVVVPPAMHVAPYLEKYQPDITSLTPAQWQLLLADKRHVLEQSGLKLVLLGGEKLYPGMEIQSAGLPFPVFHTYGMTETLSHVAYRQLGLNQGYKPVHGAALRVDAEGVVWVKNSATKDHWLPTNDVGKALDDGSIQILGRKDFVINSGGVKLHPEILEQKIGQLLLQHQIAVGKICVVGKEDAHFGEVPVLVVETNETTQTDASKIMVLLQEALDRIECPKIIHIMKVIPALPSGKIDRLAIKHQVNQGF